MLHGRTTKPVANLQVCHEGSGGGESRAHHATHDQCGSHAAGTFQTSHHHDDGRENQGHERHTADRVGADDGNRVGCDGGEKEGDDGDNEQGDNGEEDIAVHHVKIEEKGGNEEGEDSTEGNDFSGEVTGGAGLLFDGSAGARHFGDKGKGVTNDFSAVDNAEDARHRNTADADAFRIAKELFGTCRGCQNGSGITASHD